MPQNLPSIASRDNPPSLALFAQISLHSLLTSASSFAVGTHSS
jgi:hypothetical protein